jgi:GMP synthase (glutamine-hydrolysing)
MEQTVLVVDASIGDTPAERNITREIDAETVVVKPSDGERPPAVTGPEWQYDAVVLSGSQTAVYDDEQWIHDLTDWFRGVHDAGIPTLGICWGHQFTAQALGGRVVDMHEYELGYRAVTRLGDDPLFEGVPQELTAFQTHSDRVAELPPGAVTLARNEIGVQSFRVGASYGIQFHAEYDRETAEWVVGNKDLTDERRADVLATINDDNIAAADRVRPVFDNFLALATRQQPATGGVQQSATGGVHQPDTRGLHDR